MVANDPVASDVEGTGPADCLPGHVGSRRVTRWAISYPPRYIDKEPVGVLFILISTTTKVHLHLISKLAFMLHNPSLINKLESKAPEKEIFQTILNLEKRLGSGDPSAADFK